MACAARSIVSCSLAGVWPSNGSTTGARLGTTSTASSAVSESPVGSVIVYVWRLDAAPAVNVRTPPSRCCSAGSSDDTSSSAGLPSGSRSFSSRSTSTVWPGPTGPTWSSTAIGVTASVAAITVTVTVAVAVPPRPSSTEYVKATSPGEPSGVTASAGGVNVTAPPPSATAATPADGAATSVTCTRSPSGSLSLSSTSTIAAALPATTSTESSNASGGRLVDGIGITPTSTSPTATSALASTSA